jgi:hypothetical protein
VFDFVAQLVLVAVFYWPGWVVLRVVTFGRYPPHKGSKHNEEFVAACGLATLIVALGFIYS